MYKSGNSGEPMIHSQFFNRSLVLLTNLPVILKLNKTPALTIVLPSLAPCPKGFLEYKGSCYKYDTDKVTWDEAFKRSIAENATLLSLNSLLEVDFLGMVLVSGRDGPAWIGLNDR